MHPSQIEDRARDLLLDVLPEAQSKERASEGDFELALDGVRLLVRVKSLRQARIDDLIGRLSTAVLEFRAAQGAADTTLVALVHVPKFGARSVAPIRAFMAQVAPETGWGLFDDRDGHVLVIPALGIDAQQRGRRKPSPAPTPPRRLFTDLNRWLLKLLLLSRSPPANFSLQTSGTPIHPSDWAELGDVSHQTAYTLAKELEKRSLLAHTDQGLQLLDPRKLVEEWLREEALYPAPRVWVRDALRGRPVDEVFSGAPVAVGGFEAASRLGLLHVAGVGVPELHVRGPIEPLLAERGLVQVERRDANFGLIHSSYTESVFRGAHVLDRLPIVDVLQSALDVVASKARGHEQAEYLVDRILEWQ
ncbi:MAG: hypothetical protein ACI9VR_003376 [Cognaticolwellia sp.]|jgi:hypothetical protein